MATAAQAERQSVAMPGGKQVLVAGASRGIGLGLAKSFAAHGWNVVATERNHSARLQAVAAAAHGRIRIEQVDINDAPGVETLHRQLADDAFDVIFIVAGVNEKDTSKPIHQVPVDEAVRVFVTNAYSPIRFAEIFFNRLKPGGTVALMSSQMGSVALAPLQDGIWEAYRASKAALNMLARCFYERHRDAGRTVLLMHPGVVKTDMGGESAPLDLETSVEGLYTTLRKWHGSGKQLFVDYQGNEIPW